MVIARAQPKLMPARAALLVEDFFDMVVGMWPKDEAAPSGSGGSGARNGLEDALEVESMVARLFARYPVV